MTWVIYYAYSLADVAAFANANNVQPGELVISSSVNVRSGLTYYVTFLFYQHADRPVVLPRDVVAAT